MKLQRLSQSCLWHIHNAKHILPAAAATNLVLTRATHTNHGKYNSHNSSHNLALAGGAAAAALLAGGVLLHDHLGLAAESAKRSTKDVLRAAGARVPGLPVYSNQEVGERSGGGGGKRIWVSYKHGVYDITEFVQRHPGAANILKAAGGPVEPFWETYAVHKNNPEVYEMLEGLRVGNLREEDVKANASQHLADQFSQEPKRSGVLVATSQKPFNAEPPVEEVRIYHVTHEYLAVLI